MFFLPKKNQRINPIKPSFIWRHKSVDSRSNSPEVGGLSYRLESGLNSLKIESKSTKKAIDSVLSGEISSKEKYESAKAYLEELKSPIDQLEQFNGNIHDVDGYEKLIDQIKSDSLTQGQLLNLQERPVGHFFSKDLNKSIQIINSTHHSRMLLNTSLQEGESEIGKLNLHSEILKEDELNSQRIKPNLDPTTKSELIELFTQINFYKKKQLKDYLSHQAADLKGDVEKLQINSDARTQVSEKISSFESAVNDPRLFNQPVKVFFELLERIKVTKSAFEDISTSIEKSPSSESKELIQASIDKIKKGTADFSSPAFQSRVDQAIQAIDQNPELVKSPILQKERATLLALKNGGHKEITKELEQQFGQFDQLSNHEKVELKSVAHHIDKLLGADFSVLRGKIKGAHDFDNIESLLEEYLGREHVDLVDRHTFMNYGPNKKDLSKFTTKGGMVFYERGDEWKIVINYEEVKNDLNFLKKQLNHELLHVEFENNPHIKESWKKKFIQAKNWKEVREAYINTLPDKSPPNGKEWLDEDVLSELYAMQEDQVFKNPSEVNYKTGEPADLLNKALWKARGQDLEEKIRGYDDADSDGDSADLADKESTPSAGSPEILKSEIQRAQDNIESLSKSTYVKYLPGASGLLSTMNSYNKETAQLNNEYAKTESGFLGQTIKSRIEMVEKDIKELNAKLAEIGESIPSEGGNYVRDIWNRSRFITPEAFLQLGKDVMEWWGRRHGRLLGDTSARIGTAIGDKMPLPYVGEYGMEAKARAEKAEAEEVNEWKSRLENKDASELLEILKDISKQVLPNADQLKAILRILADKGRIDWRMPELWIILSKLQTSVNLTPNDSTLLKNPILLKQRLHTAIGEIYDYDEYPELERTNQSNYEGGKEKYSSSFDKIQDQIGEHLKGLFAKFKNGEEVDPLEYEGAIDYCIKQGKYFSEGVMFYIIAGIAEGILTPDRGLALDKDPNAWPPTQWITAHNPPMTQADYRFYANTYFKDSLKNMEPGEDFIDFYWTIIQNNDSVIGRTRKSVSERKWDHDWSRAIAPMGDANTAKRFLAGRSSQQEAKDTAVENSYAGAWMWLQRNAKHPERIDAKKGFARQAAWVAMADGIIAGVAYYNGASDTYTRGNDTILNNPPREGGVTGHKNWSTRQYRDKIRNFLDRLDPQFFRIIQDETSAKSDPQGLGQRARDYLIQKYPALAPLVSSATNIDQIYDKLNGIIGYIVENMSDDAFASAISQVRIDDAA